MTAFERRAHFNAESERLRVDAASARLVTREDSDKEWARLTRAITSELDQVVPEMARDLRLPAEILAKIGQKVDVMRKLILEGAGA